MRPIHRKIFATAWLLSALIIGNGATAATVRVPADAATIQAGVDAAAEGDTVLVAPGTYTGLGNHSINFSATTGSSPHNVVLVSEGGADVTIIDVDGSDTSPRRGFLFRTQESSASVVDGFTVTRGFMSVEESRPDTDVHDLSGGGMVIRNLNTSPIIRNCIFDSNHSQFSGGGIEVEVFATPTIQNCVFKGNSTSLEGGGLALESNSRPVVENCVFIGNHALTLGGGISVSTGNMTTPLVITACTIAGNRAVESGGGVSVRFPAFVELERTIVWNNCSADSTDSHAIGLDSGLTYTCAIVDSAGAAPVDGTLVYGPDTRYTDPYFCDPRPCQITPTAAGSYEVAEDSIALPALSACGAAIGAEHAGCPPVVPVRTMSWSELKRLNR